MNFITYVCSLMVFASTVSAQPIADASAAPVAGSLRAPGFDLHPGSNVEAIIGNCRGANTLA
jgi:hypothetical protein